MEILECIAKICSNVGYATIIAAIITAIAGFGVAFYSKHKQKTAPPESDDTPQTVAPFTPNVDPLSCLVVDAAEIKDIGKEDIYSQRYIETLATRIELLKNPNSEVDVFYAED